MNHSHHDNSHLESVLTNDTNRENFTVDDNHAQHFTSSHADYFHTQNNFRLIFETVDITDSKSLASACVILFLVAFFQEAITLMRSKLLVKTRPKQFLNKTCTQRICSGWHLLQTLLHAVQMFISCVLMLSMMTFHAWLVVAIILGGTVGYYTLGNSNRQFAGTHTRFYEENKL